MFTTIILQKMTNILIESRQQEDYGFIIFCKFVYHKYSQFVCTESNAVVNQLKFLTQNHYLEIINFIAFFADFCYLRHEKLSVYKAT